MKNFFFKKTNRNFYLISEAIVKQEIVKMVFLILRILILDTFKESDNFFSYRRSQKLGESDYGRCISIISLVKN